MTSPGRMDLRRRLAQASLPLAVALVVVVTVSAPTAYYLLSVRELRSRAATAATAVADVLAADAAVAPDLWSYNSIKIVRHVRAFRGQADGARFEVIDHDGDAIELGATERQRLRGHPIVWARAPVRAGAQVVGEVWVALSLRTARRRALQLALGFFLLALLLGGMMYLIPLRIVGAAERRILALVRALEGSQSDLEAQIADRVADLEEAYDSLKSQDARMRELSSRSAGLQEAQRRRIARDLHDSTAQVLTAVRINVQLMGQRASDGENVEQLAAATLELADAALEEVRRAVRSLGPSILDEVGLQEALARMCVDLAERSAMTVECDVEVPHGAIAAAAEVACYRIVQEALTNAERHARASAVRVQISCDAGMVHVVVTDDGRGFAAGTARGRGLSSMRERAELLGGALRIRTEPGAGTTVSAGLPVGRPDRPGSSHESDRV